MSRHQLFTGVALVGCGLLVVCFLAALVANWTNDPLSQRLWGTAAVFGVAGVLVALVGFCGRS